LRQVLVSTLVALGLLAVGEAATNLLPVRVSIERKADGALIEIDGGQHSVSLAEPERAAHLRFEQPGPAEREYQIDGSDTTARHDRDPAQFRAVQDAVWYRVLGWLRDEGGYSRWDNVRLVDLADGRLIAQGRAAVEASSLPPNFRLEAALYRPEAPARIWLEGAEPSNRAGLTIERDPHAVRWLVGTDADEAANWFFPNEVGPFAAELLQLVGRSAAAAIGLLVMMGALAVALQRLHVAARCPPTGAVVGGVIGVWLTAELWITVRVYHQLPHIVDAQAYFFQAHILETGRTWLQPPGIVHFLDGFQQVIWHDRWFSQYPPGAPALYAAGDLVGLAWLVGPLAGLALLGGTAAAGWWLFGRSVALTALCLLALSPFLLFQAGSFMSHPIAGAELACSLAAFAYAIRTGRQALFGLTGILLGAAFDTREITALLYGVPYSAWLLAHRRWRGLAYMALAGLPFVVVYLVYNLNTTGDALSLPRNLFNENDRWGFGVPVANGAHTLAAGLVNTDENLTLLQFDLFGWPPLFGLSLIGLPFLLGKATRRDLLLAACGGAFIVFYVGYFYQGIALGPRYYFEALPALVLLSARGLQAVSETVQGLGVGRTAVNSGIAVVVALLSAYSIIYYLPHAVDRRMDYGALNNGRRLVMPFVETTLGGPRLTRVEPPAMVLVQSDDVFKTLSALNCPLLDANHIGECPVLLIRAGLDEQQSLLNQFPGRAVWVIQSQGALVTLDRVRPRPAENSG
jgi:hypothetical protein